ncbi:MAG: SpoVA/SpoVAEb family sporulation membrane protein [Clostridia bacterium]|nr:SpoVA/SpoVAEb family sporulation membrane protein [Clostridia bacterium]
MNKENYNIYISRRAKKSPFLKNCCFAFLFGGSICALGRIFLDIYLYIGMEQKDASSLVSMTIIFIAFLLTAFGVFDNIAKIAGGGTLVPITGFANSVVSAAIDSKSEGYVLGVGAKIFSIAGPVILYGITSGTIYGIIYYFWTLLR